MEATEREACFRQWLYEGNCIRRVFALRSVQSWHDFEAHIGPMSYRLAVFALYMTDGPIGRPTCS